MSTLGIIGCGKMGRALLGGILEAGLYRPEEVFVHDAFTEAVNSIASEFSVHPAGSNAGVIENAETILLCVKPQTFSGMMAELGETEGRLLISIAAGIRIETIEKGTGNKHRVIRVMPNTPALIGRGASAHSLGSNATVADANLTEKLLASVGFVTRVSEDLLDAVTAVSGSGPAYFFFMIEAMVRGGVDQGLDEKTALELAAHTAAGAAELVLQTGESPAQLRENVTSPNGTTFAALESMRADNYERVIRNAIQAAKDRSVELAEIS